MASAYRKDIARTIRGNLKRFVSIAVICALGVAMFCGLRASCTDLRDAADRFFDAQRLYDVQVLSTLGLDDDDIEALAGVEGVQSVEGGWAESTYTAVSGARASVEVKAISDTGMNEPYVVEGRLPETGREVAVTQKFIDASGLGIGDTVELDEAEDADEAVFARHPYTICGIVIDAADVNNPQLSFRSSSTSDYTFLVTTDAVESTDTYTVAYLALEGTEGLACFSDEYADAVRAVTDRIDDEIRADREAARTETVVGDAQAELDDARGEYERERADAEAELADGRAELDDAAAQLADAAAEIARGERQVADGQAEIDSGQAELDAGWDDFDAGAAQGRATLEQTLSQARADGQAQLDAQIAAGRAQGQAQIDARFDIARQQAQAELDAAIEQARADAQTTLDERFAASREQAEAELDAQIEAGYQQGLAQIDERFDAERADARAQLEETLAAQREQGLAALRADHADLYKLYDSCTEAVEAARGRVDQIAADITARDEAQAGIEEAQRRIEALDPNAPDYEDQLSALEQQITGYRQTIADINAAYENGPDAALTAAQAELDTAQQELSGPAAQIAQLEGALDAQIEAAREQGQAKIEDEIAPAYQQAVDALEQTIAEQREQAEAELADRLAAEYDAAVDGMGRQIEAQRAAAQAELDSRLDAEYTAAVGALDGQIETQRASAQATLEDQLAAGRASAYAQLEAELAPARSQLEQAASRLAQARGQLANAVARLADGRAEYEDGLVSYQDGLAEWEEGRAEADERFADAEAELADAQAKIDDIDAATWYVQPRSSNSSFSSISSDADSIEAIGTLFPIVFLVVAVLVSLTTITRLVEEERGLIGTYKALGYRNREIFAKYLVYALAACLAGCAVGLLLGFIGLPAFIFWVFDIMYLLPGYRFLFEPAFGFGGSAIFIVAIAGTAYVACRSEVRRTPAALMRPKAPRSGSRIFLERISFVWSRLSFLNKVTARNLFRYKRRFFMTVAGILGCTALIVCGFAIKDSVGELVPEQYERIDHYDIMAVTEAGEHEQAASELAGDDRVSEFMRMYIDSATLKFDDREESVQLIVVPDDCPSSDRLSDYVAVTDRDTQASLDLPDTGAVITQNAAEVLGFGAGSTVELQDSHLEQADVAVSAVARNFLGNYAYMSESAYLDAFGDRASALDDGDAFEPNGVLVRCTDADAAADLADELGDDARFLSVTSTDELAEDFSQSFMLINAIVAIVLGMAAALAFAVLFTLSTTNISERERELATIKVLGFRPREVHHYVNKETIILTLVGIACGLPCGYVLGDVLLHALKMPSISFMTVVMPTSYVLAAILPLVFALVVNLITNRSLNRIDMIEALKSVE